MYLTIHTPIALIIGSQVNSAPVAFILGWISHFLLDLIPHDAETLGKWQNKSVLKTTFIALIDLFFLTILIFVLWQTNKIVFSSPIIWAIIGAILPDFIWGLNDLTKNKITLLKKFFNFHHRVHQIFFHKIFISTPLAIFIQIFFLTITLFLYFIL